MQGGPGKGGSNPLNQVLKREGTDNSLFRDRHGSPSGSGSSSQQQAFRPLQQQAPAAPGQVSQVPHPFNLSHLSQALSQPGPMIPQQQGQHAGPARADFSADWDRYQQRAPGPQQFHQPQQPQASGWADSFHQGKGKGREMAPAAAPQMMGSQGYGGQQMMGYPSNPFGQLQTYQPQLQSYHHQQQPMQASAGHAQMEAAFEQALADARAQNVTKEETKEETKEAVVEEKTEEKAEETKEFKGDLDAVWESLKPEAERLGKLAEWEKEFSQFVDGEDDTFDILQENLEREDVGYAGLDEQFEFGTGQDLDREGMTEDGLPKSVQYQFTTPNRFDDLMPTEAWIEANRVLASGGSLSDGALLIETFLRRATDADMAAVNASRAQAWSILGRTHAENEMEDRALQAFEEGRKALIENPAPEAAGELLTNLAISYVNESLDLAALTTLHQLLATLHPQHAGTAPSRTEFISSDNPWALHKGMTDRFLALARDQYQQKNAVDPDVQVALGTLYYMMGEFGEARSCWVAALAERPDDYLLWNRLGATLANGGDPEEAVDAYRRALEIKPTFTRAIANLGVACLNIGVHREAAEHFLAALALQPNDGAGGSAAPEAYSLWATLRRALIALDMPELAEQARPGTDLGVFRRAGFDF